VGSNGLTPLLDADSSEKGESKIGHLMGGGQGVDMRLPMKPETRLRWEERILRRDFV